MSVTYHYRRFCILYQEEHDTLDDALKRAEKDIGCNTAHPEKIVLEDGTELSNKEILDRIVEKWNK